MYDKIDTIIFDFGGILLDLDYERTYAPLRKLFNLPEGPFAEDIQLILDEYEMGMFSEGSFMHRLQRKGNTVVTERAILDAWNGMLLDLPIRRLKFVQELRKEYKVYLLSNTNHTHIGYLHRVMLPNIGVTNFEENYFEKVYYSHQIKMRKPNHNIYQYVLRDADLDGSKCIFIDDNFDNVRSAQAVGINAVRHDPNLEIMDELFNYLESVQ